MKWESYLYMLSLQCGSLEYAYEFPLMRRKKVLRESSFNMTRGGDEDIEGGLRKFLHTRRGRSEKFIGLEEWLLNFYYQRKGGAPKKLNRYRGGLLKFQTLSFKIFIPPIIILNELSLILILCFYVLEIFFVKCNFSR